MLLAVAAKVTEMSLTVNVLLATEIEVLSPKSGTGDNSDGLPKSNVASAVTSVSCALAA